MTKRRRSFDLLADGERIRKASEEALVAPWRKENEEQAERIILLEKEVEQLNAEIAILRRDQK